MANPFMLPMMPGQGGLLPGDYSMMQPPGMAPQSQGLLGQIGTQIQRGFDSPLTHLGIGILGADGRIGQGLGQGMQTFQKYRQQAEMSQYRQLMMRAQMQKLAMERETARREAQAAQRYREALPGLLDELPESVRALAASGALKPKDMLGLLTGKDTDDIKEYKQAVAQGFGGSFMDYMTTMKKAGRNIQSMTMLPGGYKPQTGSGKTVQDLMYFKELLEEDPNNKEAQHAVNTLESELYQKQMGGVEELRARSRMVTAGEIGERFSAVANVNPGITGPIYGQMTLLLTDDNFWGRLAQSFVEPTVEQGELRAMMAQMKSMLGTALSGAAIPEKEWPTYQAQLPTVTDTKNQRVGKLRTFRKMLTELEQIRLRKAGANSEAGMVLSPNQPPANPNRVVRGRIRLTDQ